MVVLLLAVSCGLEKVGEYPHSNSEGIWTGPSYGKDIGEGCHAVVVEYQYGYDWHESVGSDDVRCHLTLCQGTVPVLRVPVADSCYVSSNPLCHRIRNGHLYTDMTDGNQTVVKRDGREIYRCEGAESVLDIRETDSGIHSLSEREGGGFTYRIDGELCIERQSGRLFGPFEAATDSLCFFFSQKIMTAEGSKDAFYMVVDSKIRKFDVAEDVVKVWDMGLFDGQVCMLASFGEDTNPMFVCGQERLPLYDFYGNRIILCSFMPSGTKSVYTRILHPGQNLMTDILWFGEGQWDMYPIGTPLSAVCVGDGLYGGAVNTSESIKGHIYRGKTGFLLPDGYAVTTFESMTVRDSALYVGLSPLKGNNPMIWKDGDLDTLRLNGYITCLE